MLPDYFLVSTSVKANKKNPMPNPKNIQAGRSPEIKPNPNPMNKPAGMKRAPASSRLSFLLFSSLSVLDHCSY